MIAEALFGLVGPKAHREQWVKDIDALFDGFGYGPLEALKGNFQGRGPLEGILWREQVAEKYHDGAKLFVGENLVHEAKPWADVRNVW